MKPKQSKRKITRISAFDYYDFTFTLNLSANEASELNLSNINLTKDLAFIAKDNKLMDKITISSDSTLINTLLYINKSNKTKTFIEITTFNSINLSEEESFFRGIVTYVSEHNFLFINEAQISNHAFNIKFNIKSNGELIKEFYFGSKPEKDALKRDDITELSAKLVKEFNHEFVFFDLNSILQKISSISSEEVDSAHITLDELVSMISTIKAKYKTIKLIFIFPLILKNISVVTYNILLNLNGLLSIADIVLFEKKEGVAFFNLANSLNKVSFKEEKGKVSDTQLENLYAGCFDDIKDFSFNGKNIVFIDDFSTINIFEGTNNPIKNVINNRFYFDLFPKINHTNQKLVEEYKKQCAVNKELLKSIFFGGYLSRFLNGFNISSSVKAGSEITKRILELLKLELDFPLESDFYLISIKKINDSELNIKQKETNFKLDCINKNQSSLNTYNPLRDNNLYSFFSSNIIRKHLKDIGFINTKGFLLEDPEKKVRSSSKGRNNDFEIEKKLLIAIKENESKSKEKIRKNLINKSKLLHDASIKELEKQSRIKDYTKEYHLLLPSFDYKTKKLKPIKGYSSLNYSKETQKVSYYISYYITFNRLKKRKRMKK